MDTLITSTAIYDVKEVKLSEISEFEFAKKKLWTRAIVITTKDKTQVMFNLTASSKKELEVKGEQK
jgi:hypothetical protein